jgi:hypothetical protein
MPVIAVEYREDLDDHCWSMLVWAEPVQSLVHVQATSPFAFHMYELGDFHIRSFYMILKIIFNHVMYRFKFGVTIGFVLQCN